MTNEQRPPTSEDMIRDARERWDKVEGAEVEAPRHEVAAEETQPTEPQTEQRSTRPTNPRHIPTPVTTDNFYRTPWYQRRWVRWVAGFAIFWGIGFISQLNDAERDGSGEIIEAGVVPAFEAQVGDCLVGDTTAVEIAEWTGVPCSEAHDVEVYALVDHPAPLQSQYPGDDALLEWGDEKCLEGFSGYVGSTWEDVSDLDYLLLTPTRGAWADGEREVTCGVIPYELGEKLVGSKKDVGPDGVRTVKGTVAWYQLSIGDCLAVPPDGDHLLAMTELSCNDLHDMEVYAFPYHPAPLGSEWPGDEVLARWAETQCQDTLNAHLVDEVADDYGHSLLYPIEESWRQGDRGVICFGALMSAKATTGGLPIDSENPLPGLPDPGDQLHWDRIVEGLGVVTIRANHPDGAATETWVNERLVSEHTSAVVSWNLETGVPQPIADIDAAEECSEVADMLDAWDIELNESMPEDRAVRLAAYMEHAVHHLKNPPCGWQLTP